MREGGTAVEEARSPTFVSTWSQPWTCSHLRKDDEIYLLPTTGHVLLIIAPNVNTPPSNAPTFYTCRAYAVGGDAFVQLRQSDTPADCAALAAQLSATGTT